MKRLNKKAQFFLFAAVVFSAIIISLSATANQAKVKSSPKNFKDLAYEVKHESNKVIDYQIYQGISDDKKIEDFISKIAKDILDKDPDANFMFIYGNQKKITIENYGSKGVKATPSNCQQGKSCKPKYILGGNSKITSTINMGKFTSKTQGSYLQNRRGWRQSFSDLGNPSYITISIENYPIKFDILKNKQIIFILQKSRGDESYVSLK